MPATSLHERIRQSLERQIRSGDLAPGTRLPTEAELSQTHGVSRGTAQRVLQDLARSGLVERHRRRGTFVVDTVNHASLLRFVDPKLGGPPMSGEHEVLWSGVLPAVDVDLPTAIDDDVPVNYLVRRKLDLDGEPVLWESAAIPFSVAPRLLQEDLAPLATLSYFRREGVPVATTRLYLDAVLVDDRLARDIAAEPGQPTIRQRRITWLEDGSLAEAATFIARPGSVELYIEQHAGS